MSAADDLTPEVLRAVFEASLKAGDMQGVHDSLLLMAVKDPRQADLLYQTLRVGLAIRDEQESA